MIVVATVPHTGSHFLLDLLGRDEISVSEIDRINAAIERNHRRCIFRHVYGGESVEIIERWAKHCPVVTPLRHPMAVAQSWKNRGKPVVPDGSQTASMVDLWHNLFNLKAKPIYLPIDVPIEREHQLAVLRLVTQQSLQTDWSRYGPELGTHEHQDLTPDDIAAVNELLHEPILERFYGTT